MPVFPIAHVTEDRLCTEKNAFEVDGNIEIPVLLTNLGNRVVLLKIQMLTEDVYMVLLEIHLVHKILVAIGLVVVVQTHALVHVVVAVLVVFVMQVWIVMKIVMEQ